MNFAVHRAIKRYRGDDLVHPSDKAILLSLADCAGKRDISVWPGIDHLCEDTLYKERQVRVSLKRLEQNGFIKTEKGRKEGRKIYTFILGKLPYYDTDNVFTSRGAPQRTTEELTPPPPSTDYFPGADVGGATSAPVSTQEERRPALTRRAPPTLEQVIRRNHDLDSFVLDMMQCGLGTDMKAAKTAWQHHYGRKE